MALIRRGEGWCVWGQRGHVLCTPPVLLREPGGALAVSGVEDDSFGVFLPLERCACVGVRGEWLCGGWDLVKYGGCSSWLGVRPWHGFARE